MTTMPSDPQAVLARPCGVKYSTPGTCGWCGWPKADHEQMPTLVHVCPVCGDRYHDPSWDDLDAHWQEHMARALAESEKRVELGDAWAAAEAALPEGWRVIRLEFVPYRETDHGIFEPNVWHAKAQSNPLRPSYREADAYGPTPVAALRALAAALSEPETPR